MQKRKETTYNYSISKFKVKIKSLMEEAKIIRFEESRNSGWVVAGLREHRIGIVRSEQRHTILAYCFLRGLKYNQVENNCKKAPDIKKILRIIASLANESYTKEVIENWLKGD